jgi:hypothetical protein
MKTKERNRAMLRGDNPPPIDWEKLTDEENDYVNNIQS